MFTTALTNIDSYKLGHADQYPMNTEFVYSNFTPRSLHHFKYTKESGNCIVWVGITGFLMQFNKLWNETFFQMPWEDVEHELQVFIPFVGPNGLNVQRFKDLHDLGYLPLKIKSLPEGALVPAKVPVLTIVNTHPKFGWLVNFVETWLSAEPWKAPTAATTAYAYRRILNRYVKETGGSKEFSDWQIHDFSARGMSGMLDAASAGFGHLVCSLGTDNLPAVNYARKLYKGDKTFIGGSVPATEHSVMCAGGMETEIETFSRLMDIYPSGVVSIVSDTWNLWNVIGVDGSLAMRLKNKILSRIPDSLGLAKVVFRPDSGNPVHILAGYRITKAEEEYQQATTFDELQRAPYFLYDVLDGDTEVVEMEGRFYKTFIKDYDYDEQPLTAGFIEISESEALGALRCLERTFGATVNLEGYKTLNQRVGLIYGDSITPAICEEVLSRFKEMGFASDNVVFGVGSYTYQYCTRDTLGFAMKATNVIINGQSMELFKDPITDKGYKKSANGLLRVEGTSGNYKLIDQVSAEEELGGELETVFLNSAIMKAATLQEIRERIASDF